MTREEFQKIVDDNVGVRSNKKNQTKEIKIEWTIGGMFGGNCWGDEPKWTVEPDPEPEFEELDKVLEAVCPTVTFLKYKKLLTKIKYTSESSYEYYGNYTTYGIKTISVEDIWDFLKENDYV